MDMLGVFVLKSDRRTTRLAIIIRVIFDARLPKALFTDRTRRRIELYWQFGFNFLFEIFFSWWIKFETALPYSFN